MTLLLGHAASQGVLTPSLGAAGLMGSSFVVNHPPQNLWKSVQQVLSNPAERKTCDDKLYFGREQSHMFTSLHFLSVSLILQPLTPALDSPLNDIIICLGLSGSTSQP